MTKAPYVCDWRGCGKSFKRSEHLNRHHLNHEPVKIFVCDQCPKTFVRSDLLFRHRDRHLKRAARLPYATNEKRSAYPRIRPARSRSLESQDEISICSKSSVASPVVASLPFHSSAPSLSNDSRHASPRRESAHASPTSKRKASDSSVPYRAGPEFLSVPSWTLGHYDVTRTLPLPVPSVHRRSSNTSCSMYSGLSRSESDSDICTLAPIRSQPQEALCPISLLLQVSARLDH